MSFKSGKSFLIWILPIVFFLFLAFDGITHWDETNYLYKGAFSEFDLDAHWVHYSGGFYSGRMAHILILRSLFFVFGVGMIPFFFVQVTMALFILGAGWIFSRVLKEMGLPPPLPYLGVVAFLFLPLSLYLGYKALAETTAILMAALSLYFYFSGLRTKGASGFILLGISGFALFLATNARVEYLLTFATLVLPYICFRSGSRLSAFRGLIWVGAVWVVLTAVLGLCTGIWSLQFMLQRSEAYGAKFAADSADYMPNYIVGILFGGGLWFFALLSLARWRRAAVKIAWGGMVISMVPIALLADHTELRYYSPAIFSFALTVAIGIVVFYGWLQRKLNPLRARVVTVVLFGLLVTGNQLFRPWQEVGTDGSSLARLITRVREKYPDPLLLTAHPHSTYAFSRICYPELRIALDRDFEGLAPLKVRSFEELQGQEEPWLYLSSRGQKARPLLIRILHSLRGKTPIDRDDQPVIATGWVAGLDLLSPNWIDREGQYLIFRMNQGGNE